MKRFISEYAKYKINSYENNKLMGADVKTEMISNIHKALDLSKKGYISVDEAIRMIYENWIKWIKVTFYIKKAGILLWVWQFICGI